jgi:hypothetical protein
MWQNNLCAPLEICSSAFGLIVWAVAVGFITGIEIQGLTQQRFQLDNKFVVTSVRSFIYKTPFLCLASG